ncbi:MAG TPA: N-acetylmuramoyl-L-alanine amidase [Longimicrobiales bacterium]
MRTLLLLAIAASPTALAAQAAPLRVAGAGAPSTIALAMDRGYPAYSVAALERLGAAVTGSVAGARAVVFGDTLRFETFSPFFRVNGKVQQLVSPVYREDGILYLPRQLFSEWLPRRYPDRLRFEDGTLRLLETGVAVAAADTATAPRVVIIDAGHGGRDPGKPGPGGLLEKDVALAVAHRLAAELDRRGGYEVHLTRTTDTLIALADRPRLANEWKAGRPAALFISLHANSHRTQARGFETFFLSEARTEDERRVAEMENAAIAYEERRGVTPSDDIEWILNNLRNDFYLRASNDLAEVIQREIAAFHPGPNRGVKQAGFRVLVGAFMPAVLVEMAFISNRQEARLLGRESFQRKMASGLADAIDRFFSSHEHLWVAGGAN